MNTISRQSVFVATCFAESILFYHHYPQFIFNTSFIYEPVCAWGQQTSPSIFKMSLKIIFSVGYFWHILATNFFFQNDELSCFFLGRKS